MAASSGAAAAVQAPKLTPEQTVTLLRELDKRKKLVCELCLCSLLSSSSSDDALHVGWVVVLLLS
jgi:hypothetical protein